MATKNDRAKKESGDTENTPEAAALNLPGLGDIKEYLRKADRILELLSKLVDMWSAVNPNAPQQMRGDGITIPNPPASGRVHLEANNGTLQWTGYP